MINPCAVCGKATETDAPTITLGMGGDFKPGRLCPVHMKWFEKLWDAMSLKPASEGAQFEKQQRLGHKVRPVD